MDFASKVGTSWYPQGSARVNWLSPEVQQERTEQTEAAGLACYGSTGSTGQSVSSQIRSCVSASFAGPTW